MHPVLLRIVEILLMGIVAVAIFGALAAGLVGCFLFCFSALKGGTNLRSIRAAMDRTAPKKRDAK